MLIPYYELGADPPQTGLAISVIGFADITYRQVFAYVFRNLAFYEGDDDWRD